MKLLEENIWVNLHDLGLDVGLDRKNTGEKSIHKLDFIEIKKTMFQKTQSWDEKSSYKMGKIFVIT